MRHLLKRKRTVAFLWLISYIFLLIIPVFGNTYILMTVNTAVNEEVQLKYSYFLKSMGANIDFALKDMNNLVYKVRTNESVRSISLRTEVDPQLLFDLMKTAKEVEALRSGYSNALEVFVYFPRTDMIIFENSYLKAGEFFEFEKQSEIYDAQEYREQLSSREFCAFRDVIMSEKTGKNVYYRFVFPSETNDSMDAVVCVGISSQSLFGAEIDFEKNDVVILSKGDDIYLGSSDFQKEDLAVVKNLEEGQIGYTKINGEPVGVAYIKSDVSISYKYVFIDRSGSLHSASRQILTVGILISTISILLMLLILYKLYGWNYLNIKDIMNTLGDGGGEEELGENEFEIIKSRITAAKHRQQSMKKEVNLRQQALKEEFIIDLMTGVCADDAYISEGMKKYGISFEGRYFCVSALKVREFGVLENLGLKHTHYIIQNIMDDMLKNESYCSCEHNGLLFYIFNFKENSHLYDHLYSILSECCEVTKMATEIVFSSATGEVGEGIESLPKLYASAMSVYNLSEFYGMDEHVFQKDLEAQLPQTTPIYSANIENEIIISIKEGNEKHFYDTVDKLFNKYVLVNHEWVVMGLAYSALNSIFKLIDMSGSEHTQEAFEKLNSFRDYNNIEKIKNFIKSYGVFAIEIFHSEKEEKAELYEKAIEYINGHYTESDLNVARVSEYIGVTAIYLAYIVKQNAGVKLSEYIAKLRIDKAKSLLDADSEIKVEEVARQSGFWQNRTFYNTFKKYTGLTPTQYKVLKKNQENQS